MLGAALAMLVLVSAFVAFGSWPGEKAGRQIDQVLLNEVANAKAERVAVGTAAVNANRKAATRRRIAVARGEREHTGGDRGGDPIARTPGGSAPTTAAGTPVASAPADSSPVNTVRQQTQDVTRDVSTGVQDTTQQLTDQTQQQVDQTTTQVKQVVDQVVSGVDQTTSTTVQQVQDTVGSTTGTVTGTVGGVLGK